MAIYGLGSLNPQRMSATAEAMAVGVDVTSYAGWPFFQVASEQDHPSTMGAQALDTALSNAKLDAKDLDFIIFTGMSRDYLPSWSVATAIAESCGATCIGLDLTIGCLGMTIGLETASGWLNVDSTRRFGAIVSAERWAFTVDRSDISKSAMWAHADGAAAIIVGKENVSSNAIAVYEGLSVRSAPEMNGFVRIKTGGTRHPSTDSGRPFERELRGDAKRDLFPKYLEAFKEAISERKSLSRIQPKRAVCNQISPNILTHIDAILDVCPIPRTGLEHGHVGGCDTVLGLQMLLGDSRQMTDPTILLASSPYAFAAASLYPPE